MLDLEFLLGMASHEFTQEQLNGPKNVLGYPEIPNKSSNIENVKQRQVIFESRNHKISIEKKSK